MRTSLVFALLVLASSWTALSAQSPAPGGTLPEAEVVALELLQHYDGIWDARWEWFDPDGHLIGEMVGTEEYTSKNDYLVIAENRVPEFGIVSYGLISYNPLTREILLYSVGDKGDNWLMRGDPFTGKMVSDPHLEPDGSESMIRFTHEEKSRNTMTIVMERSTDAGDSWVVGFRQYLVRRTD